MAEKDTAQLENELSTAESLEQFFDDNAENFCKLTPAQYLEQLLKEKNLSKAEVAKKIVTKSRVRLSHFRRQKKYFQIENFSRCCCDEFNR